VPHALSPAAHTRYEHPDTTGRDARLSNAEHSSNVSVDRAYVVNTPFGDTGSLHRNEMLRALYVATSGADTPCGAASADVTTAAGERAHPTDVHASVTSEYWVCGESPARMTTDAVGYEPTSTPSTITRR